MLDYIHPLGVTDSGTTMSSGKAGDMPVPIGLIGPNSIIQLHKAAIELLGKEQAEDIFQQAGMADLFHKLPSSMIDEALPEKLFTTLFNMLPYPMARRVALRAGEHTADYIIANRIPAPVCLLLKVLPPKLSGAMLLQAIKKNAWTFVGSGCFTYESSPVCLVSIASNPLTMPECAWHVAVFQRLFSKLVCKESKVKYLNTVARIPGKDNFIICYGKKFFVRDCERARKHKLKYFCSHCVS